MSAAKDNLGLAKWAEQWLGRPYWYGTVVRLAGV